MPLRELSIRNFAIIKQLEIDIQDGLTVVTGETGAGKSIVLDALNLLLGARADAHTIRHNEDQCELSALFDIAQLKSVIHWLSERDLYDESNQAYCLIRRIIRRDRPTKCYINDQPTTLGSLRELGLLLVDLHDQHEHQSLLRKSTQRRIVDHFAGHDDTLNKLAGLAARIKRKQKQLDELQQNNSASQDRLDLLAFQLNELDEAQIGEGEFEQLSNQQSLLANAQELQIGLQQALQKLHLDDAANITTDLGNTIRELSRFSAIPAPVQQAVKQLDLALSEIDDAIPLLSSALNQIEQNPQKLAEVEQRMQTIVTLARKHRCAEQEISTKHQQLSSELTQLKSAIEQPEALAAELHTLIADYQQIADKVSKNRQSAANTLSEKISQQMQVLGMSGGEFKILVEPQSNESLVISENGIDEIDYQVSSNTGMPFRTMIKTASGGELSRISLAIQLIASQEFSCPTLVFDEVDVGVGGRVAGIVGERLQQLGRHAQVICITHLPQVAAHGDHHLAVDKISSNYETWSKLVAIENEQRVAEIARMLGGQEITEQTLAHAREMLDKNQTYAKKAS